MNRRVLLALAVVLAAAATVLAVSGGFRTTVGGFRISARSPFAAAAAFVLVTAAWFALARRAQSIAADLEAGWHFLERHASRLIGVVALIAAMVASTFATRSAAGADASGYLSQATLWYRSRPMVADELSLALVGAGFDWPSENHEITTPLGWRPMSVPGVQAPTYPPGLPMLMAYPEAWAGIDGAQAVIVAATALAVWTTGAIAGGVAGILAATILAFLPVFLYQSIQPMSDVPVTAAWMMCFLIAGRPRHAFAAGVCCALAVLIRPNLAPLAVVPWLLVDSKLRFTIPVAAAGAFLMFLQSLLYGSPFRSGYGSAGELFALSNVLPNAALYSKWLIATAPLLLVGVVAMVRLRHITRARGLIAFAALVVAAYLVYAQFEHWSYLRFLLPALAVLAVFAGFELALWIDRRPVSWRLPIGVALLLGIIAHGLYVARSLDTFKLRDQLRRVAQVAEVIDRAVPADAVLIAGEQSGSMRYYTGRSIIRWEAASPEAMATSVETLLASGRPVYIVLDAWEDSLVKARFPGFGPAELDWPPMVEAGSSHRTKVWNLADRFRFQIGQRVNTLRIP